MMAKGKDAEDEVASVPMVEETVEADADIFDADGALTRVFLLERGFCCENGCKNCPYGFRRAMTLTQALIFDFDGLILETESPVYQAWLEVYEAHGCDLPLAKWCECVGKAHGTFDPHIYLETQLGRALEREAIRARRHARFTELMAAQTVLPGVAEYIAEAKRLGLKVGLASSSPFDWISRNLSLFNMLDDFDAIKCADDVTHTKPDPAVYLAVLQALEVESAAAIAFEDSPNGLLAAKRAGIFCVAVPNAITRQLAFDNADLTLASLAELSLEELLGLKDDAIEVGSA